jgi:hypothetical protein
MADLLTADTPMDGASDGNSPLVTFYRLFPEGRLPERADNSAAGTMPMRAYRYCEAMRTASAFGWYVFPPVSFSVVWDGGIDALWTYKGAGDWYPLKTAQFPDFAKRFDAAAPPELRGYSPPFLATGREPGIIQVWSGLVARTAPGWSLLVRHPANLPHSQGYESYEGIIETDHWFGPLFSNIRITRTHVPVEFDADFPFLQVQPVHREAYGQAIDDFEVVSDITRLDPGDWEAFRSVVNPSAFPDRQRGHYATSVRRRRKRKSPDSDQ